MLDKETFATIIDNAPLVSTDLCLVYNNKILLGKRKNEPLKGYWFTPGGRIVKNESHQDCLKRVAFSELGLSIDRIGILRLMGVWDHFYPNSSVDENMSTHYVNLPHYCFLREQPIIVADNQHDKFSWFDLEIVKESYTFHEYLQNYACWLINMENEVV